MAAGRHQDLISFSWGAPRSIEEHEQDAPSLEIKSTRQVAKAVPVKEHAHERTQGKHGDTPVNNAETFHHAESNAHVDVPEETTDSLVTICVPCCSAAFLTSVIVVILGFHSQRYALELAEC